MIKDVKIIGMGALGLLYANHISEVCGPDAVSFVMDESRIAKYKDKAFSINGTKKSFSMISADEATPADLLIVAVKYTALESIYPIISKCVDEHTIVMSVLNGITSEELIAKNCGCKNILYTVAQGMDAMKFGDELTYTQMGNLHIGITENEDENKLLCIKEYFDSIKMPYVEEEDILYRLWFKYMLNVGCNQICMMLSANYGELTTPGTEAFMYFVSAMREVKAISEYEGVKLTEEDIAKVIEIIKTLSPTGVPSMAQDRLQKRYSEVDMFAGAVMELGKKHNISVPVNEYIYKQVKEIEKTY